MIVVMQSSATAENIQAVIEQMVELGFDVHRTTGEGQMILAGVGNPGPFEVAEFTVMTGVQDAHRISSPYKLAGRSFRPEGTVITFPNGVKVSFNYTLVAIGPGAPSNTGERYVLTSISNNLGRSLTFTMAYSQPDPETPPRGILDTAPPTALAQLVTRDTKQPSRYRALISAVPACRSQRRSKHLGRQVSCKLTVTRLAQTPADHDRQVASVQASERALIAAGDRCDQLSIDILRALVHS